MKVKLAKTSFDKPLECPATTVPACPPSGLLTAAFAGLLAVGSSGCDDEEGRDPFLVCENEDAGDHVLPGASANTNTDAGAPAPDASGLGTDAAAPMDAGAATPADAGAAEAGPHSAAGPVVTQEIEGNRTLASMQSDCKTRGGYMQVHAACSGSNTCQGFSYGNWDPGVLTEHSCASANGCNGASCVQLQPETARTGKEVYEADKLPAGGPASCLNCHAVWNGKDAMGNYLPPDTTKFKVWVMPGSTRTLENWLQISAAEQEAIVAFGRIGYMPDGIAQVSMRGYHKLLSRGEVERAVAHIRTLTPVITEIKSPP